MAVQKNDIVFAIGPAGTGKTYQAVACAVAALKNKEIETCLCIEDGAAVHFENNVIKATANMTPGIAYPEIEKLVK